MLMEFFAALMRLAKLAKIYKANNNKWCLAIFFHSMPNGLAVNLSNLIYVFSACKKQFA